MKLIIPLILILLGVLTGHAVKRLLPVGNKSSIIPLAAGGCGAFIGLVTRDVLDITVGNALLSTLIAAIIGAALCSAIACFIQGN